MLLTAIGVAMIGIIINILLRNIKPEIATFSNIVTCLIILSLILGTASGIITKCMSFISGLGINHELFILLFKVLGISYIVEFVVDIAEESGSPSIASKIALIGKVIVAGLSLPMLFQLIELLMDII